MSWLKKVFSSQSSQETKVVIEKQKEDKKEDELQIEEDIEEEAKKESSEGSQDSWFSSWSGLSTTFSSSKKRDLGNSEDEVNEQ